MTAFQAPRGTRDLLPAERPVWARLERLAAELAARYGYREIETPLFERAEVFERGVGESTDIVEKELFRFERRSEDGERWALRPEATAGICRAYIEHGMHTWPQPVRLTLSGPMFRYDRPQAGRYRQFWQFDAEAIGDPGPAIDAEIIELGWRFYRDAGLAEVNVLLNSIGDPACRPAYVEELRSYFEGHRGLLPEAERARLSTNPLRLLDSKHPAMTELINAAPRLLDRLCDACSDHFAAVRSHLDALGLGHRIEPRLVRGLDYYTRTAFEFYQRGQEGQQQALGGGGRYDGLIERLGGRPTPGIGFALGLDRVVLALTGDGLTPPREQHVLAVVIGGDPTSTAARLRVATELRAAGLAARAELGHRKLGRQLEAAAREAAHFAVILGTDVRPDHGTDESSETVIVRDLEAATQRKVPRGELIRYLERASRTHRHR